MSNSTESVESTVVRSTAIVVSVTYLAALLERGTDPNLRHTITDRTHLTAGVGPRTHDNVDAMLNAGADVSLTDRTSHTALHLAAMISAGALVLIFLEADPDPNAHNAQDATLQSYFWRTDAHVMTDDVLENWRLVAQWLQPSMTSLLTLTPGGPVIQQAE